jgi:hypothetical protein
VTGRTRTRLSRTGCQHGFGSPVPLDQVRAGMLVHLPAALLDSVTTWSAPVRVVAVLHLGDGAVQITYEPNGTDDHALLVGAWARRGAVVCEAAA